MNEDVSQSAVDMAADLQVSQRCHSDPTCPGPRMGMGLGGLAIIFQGLTTACTLLPASLPMQRLRQQVALLRAAQHGGSAGPEVQQGALAVNAELEGRLALLQEQLGRLRQ